MGFKRQKIVTLSNEIIADSLKLLHKLSWDKSFISPVWEKVFSKFGETNLNKSKNEIGSIALKENYENYFVNGISDGACVGADLHRPRSAIKYALRGKERYRILNKHYEFKGDKRLDLENLNLSPELLSGQPWLQKISHKWINPEILDHLYFYEICKDLPVSKKNILFIGEGSGILSNIYMNKTDVQNAVFIDLPHFLIRQHIVNYNLDNISKSYITPDQLGNLVPDNQSRVLINQDSFPEIPEEYLNRYFDLIDIGYITDVFSYNKKDFSDGHTNYREMLTRRNIKCNISFESVMRKGYFIEWYSKNN